MQPQAEITIVGAGLVGALTATLLARQGRRVEVFEKRPDPRHTAVDGGRSINLALSERGLRALRQAELEPTVIQTAVMMRGRMVHDIAGHTNLQRYGVDDREVNWSVSRGELNQLLVDAAEAAGARVHFGQTLVEASFGSAATTTRLTFANAAGEQHQREAATVIGADGAGSAVRRAMAAAGDLGERVEPLSHGYKELEIPAATVGNNADFDAHFRIEPRALHIWPRGGFMCIALPNHGGSFTVTLFLPLAGGRASFAALPDSASARSFFEREFPDALALMPDFDRDYTSNPVGHLATLYLDRWHLDRRAVLIGDAAHAIVPFHGQGMNAGFEDAATLAAMLADGSDLAAVYAAFERRRKPDADAIAEMALENYVEMRDSVADPGFLLKRALGDELARRCPKHFMRRYRMVTFTHLPYAFCLEHGRRQQRLMDAILGNHDDLDAVDLDAAAERAARELPPLPL